VRVPTKNEEPKSYPPPDWARHLGDLREGWARAYGVVKVFQNSNVALYLPFITMGKKANSPGLNVALFDCFDELGRFVR
jgi:hypothetical protein